MRSKLIAGNWKMHKTVAESVALTDAIVAGLAHIPTDRAVVICPTFTALGAVITRPRGGVAVGAQNVYPEAQGAFTGEISPAMLSDIGCRYVIVGHSERRQLFGESDALIARKAAAVLNAGMTPIVCVGETRAERESGNAQSVVLGQIAGALAGLIERLAEVVVAYEPVWAIGTGLTATSSDAQTMHAAIRSELRRIGGAAADVVRIQYGGSVKPDNVDELMAQPDIDGALVGGAALVAESFLRIVQYR
ncbi:MAG: triose-phosphate isomerase [Chloroflexales bacterium]|nr:triose-phosphate isomerase [Chloroflexales bacterium]